jgi:hypothetical protein
MNARAYLSPREIADARGLNLKTVLAAIHDGRLPAENWAEPGKRPLYRVPVAALDRLRVRPREPVEVPPSARPRAARTNGRFSQLAKSADYDRGSTHDEQETK